MRPIRPKRSTQPQHLTGVDWRNPITRGLACLYNLAPGIWTVDQVTGNVGGSPIGTGITFDAGLLKTPGSVGNGAQLRHNLQTVACPVTIVVGYARQSGTVSWSLLHNAGDGQWSGWYGQTDDIQETNANDFSGGVSLSASARLGRVRNVAASQSAANNLRGVAGGGAVQVDTTSSAPTVVNDVVTLGYSKRGGVADNAAAALFSHFAVFNRALSDAELRSLADNPWQLFAPERRAFSAVASAAPAGLVASMAAQESGADSATASASVLVEAAGALAEAGEDDALGAAQVATQASLAADEVGQDSAAGGAVLAALAQLDVVESSTDTATGSASAALPDGTASAAITEGFTDQAASQAIVLVSASLAVAESSTDQAAGSVGAPTTITASMAVTEPADTAEFSVRVRASASSNEPLPLEDGDLCVANASVLILVSGAAQDPADTAAGSVSFTDFITTQTSRVHYVTHGRRVHAAPPGERIFRV